MDMIEDDNVDAGRQEIVEYGEPSPARTIPPQWRGAAIAVAAVALAGGAWFALRPSDALSRVALAVPAGSIESARANLARAGISSELRGGTLWVQASDAPRAALASIEVRGDPASTATLEAHSASAAAGALLSPASTSLRSASRSTSLSCHAEAATRTPPAAGVALEIAISSNRISSHCISSTLASRSTPSDGPRGVTIGVTIGESTMSSLLCKERRGEAG